MRNLLVTASFLLLLSAASNVGASPEVDATARSIYGDFMSPYCPGLLLADCRSQSAVNLRADIHARLEAGQPEAEVRQALEDIYGEKMRAAPAARGFGWVAWLTPFVALALGAALAMRWIRTNRFAGPPVREFQSPIPPHRRALLDADISRAGAGGDAGI